MFFPYKFKLLAVLVGLVAITAQASEGDSPIYGNFHSMLHSDFDTKRGTGQVYTHTELELGLRLGEGFSLENTLKIEQLEEHGEPKSNLLDNHLLIIEELTLDYEGDGWGGYIGKFYPTVGFVYEQFGGLYAHHFVEEYAIHERLGVGGVAEVGYGETFEGELEVAAFMADTTFMADSYLTKRHRSRRADGGVTNTHKPNSIAITFRGEYGGNGNGHGDGHGHGGEHGEGWFYALGFAHQAKGKPKGMLDIHGEDGDADADGDAEDHSEEDGGHHSIGTSKERRYSIGIGWEGEISHLWELYSINEAVFVDDLYGQDGFNRTYLVSSQRFTYDHSWFFQGLYAGKLNNARASQYEKAERENEYVVEASVGYHLTDSLSIQGGYGWQKEEGIHSPRIGLLLEYIVDFGGGEGHHH